MPGGDGPARATAIRLGAWVAPLTSALTFATFGLAFNTPPRSGPSCRFDECVGYPYTAIADYFPRDYLWMFPATVLVFVFVVLAVCLHYYAPPGRRPLTAMGVVLAALAAAVISADYFIQLTVVQPSVLRGETDGLSLISQYNPHGVFIALEALGYLVACGALLFLAAAFAGSGWVERAVRWLFVLAFGLSVGALVGFTAAYGQDVEYRFEIAVISITWTALSVGGALLTVLFRRARPSVAS